MYESMATQLSVDTLSGRVNLAAARLRQLFKKEVGQPPMQFLKDLRMRHAKELLRITFLSVKEVAWRTGSGDVSHFVRDFKKHNGVTPTQFRAGDLRPSKSRIRACNRE